MNNTFNPMVSIIIPVYNGERYLREAVDSALNQTYTQYEVIIVNDGSTDKSSEIAKSYGSKVRYYEKANGGVSSALNLAVKNMKGEYFSWLSHDDLYSPHKIESQVDLLNGLADKQCVIFSGYKIIDHNGNILDSIDLGRSYSMEQLSSPLFVFFEGLISGCTLLIHKDLIVREGGFDEELKTTQDYDLWFKILMTANICFDKNILISSRRHRMQTGRTNERVKEEYFSLWKNCFDSVSDDKLLEHYPSLEAFWIHSFLHFKRFSIDGRLTDYLLKKVLGNVKEYEYLHIASADFQNMCDSLNAGETRFQAFVACKMVTQLRKLFESVRALLLRRLSK